LEVNLRRRSRTILVSGIWLAIVSSAPLVSQEAIAGACIKPAQLRIDSVEKHFFQERHLSGVDNPLKSEGALKLTKDRITWHMTVPFDVETVITSQGITQSVDGGPAEPTGDIAGLGPKIAGLFASLLKGRWNELDTTFNVVQKPIAEGNPWAVSLQTIDPKLEEAISQIEVEGCVDISTIKIMHKNGDYELIRFDPGSASTP
jgi:hypothetical protein